MSFSRLFVTLASPKLLPLGNKSKNFVFSFVFLSFIRNFVPELFIQEQMALIKEVNGISPKWGKNCYFSENATIVGEVEMGDECSIWFNAVVRGDVKWIHIGNRTNVQDGAVLHTTFQTGPLSIGNDVTIGHNATIHACTIHDGALIGMGATLLDHCEIGEGAIVAAGALVVGGTKVGDHEIWGGVPAKFIKKTAPNQAESFAAHYVQYAKDYLAEQ